MTIQTAFAEYRKASSSRTLDSVAADFNVDRTTILRWERGNPPVPVKRLDEIEQITGISRHKLRPDIFGSHPSPAARQPTESDEVRP